MQSFYVSPDGMIKFTSTQSVFRRLMSREESLLREPKQHFKIIQIL